MALFLRLPVGRKVSECTLKTAIATGDSEEPHTPPEHRPLPSSRNSKTWEFRVGDCRGYFIVGEYADGRPGELKIKLNRQGGLVLAVMDSLCDSISYGLQCDIPLAVYVEEYCGHHFEPAGRTDDPEIPFATSVLDYVFHRLAIEYLPVEERVGLLGVNIGLATSAQQQMQFQPVRAGEAPACFQCGVAMHRAGTVFVCLDCGATIPVTG